MPVPSFTSGAIGGLLASATLAANKNVAVYLDYTAKIEGHVTARVTTGATSTANTYTKHEVYKVYGTTTINHGGGYSAGATSIVVTSATGTGKGQKIVVNNELRTISAISGTTLTIDALQNSQSDGATIYFIESIPTYPGTNALGGTADTTFTKTTYVETGRWVKVLTNTDGSQSVTVELSEDRIDSFA